MTFDELYCYGRESETAKACIPAELIQSLPRLERKNGRLVVEYWYYLYNVSVPSLGTEPLYYAAFDIREDKLVELRALTDQHRFITSWQDLIIWSMEMREVKYLEHCAVLLARGDITEEEIIDTQAMWLDCQARDMFSELYYRSGVRPEAVQKLISPEMAEKSRYILRIWSAELQKNLYQKAEGYEQLEAIWNDPVLKQEWEIFCELRGRGPIPGLRSKTEY